MDEIPGAVSTEELDAGINNPSFSAWEKETFSRLRDKFEYMKQYQTQVDGKDHSRDYFELPSRWWNNSQGQTQTGNANVNDKMGMIKQILQAIRRRS